SIDLVIHNLENDGEEFLSLSLPTKITTGIISFGDISWSPNDQYLVFSLAENITGPYVAKVYTIFLVDTEDLNSKQLYVTENQFLTFPQWLSTGKIEYTITDGVAVGRLILNIETGEVTEVQ
ncbi:MAG: hypothetical protein ACK2T7_07680, partial [Anaerolineales bacterium]